MRHESERPSSKGLINPSEGAPMVTINRVLPAADLAEVVTHFWIPRWSLPRGAEVTQRVLQFPATNLVVDADSCGLHGAVNHLRLHALSGTGWAIGALLRPGAARALLGSSAHSILNTQFPLTDPASLALAETIRARSENNDACVAVIESWLRGRAALWSAEAARERTQVNQIIDRVRDDPTLLRVEALAAAAHVSPRTLQRLLREHIGVTPKWVIQGFRLREAAHRLRDVRPPALSELAASLGYADQAHFTRDFRAVLGENPHNYRDQNAAGLAATAERRMRFS
ncbi:helix-turn-helix domain-containing protein [Klugiella xanthotipulae]|nr:helix-turn-helix domain-containing protein [Klugiella xanthotipulae]